MQTGRPLHWELLDTPTLAEIVEHPVRTAARSYRYQFTPKHHGADRDAAQWLP